MAAERLWSRVGGSRECGAPVQRPRIRTHLEVVRVFVLVAEDGQHASAESGVDVGGDGGSRCVIRWTPAPLRGADGNVEVLRGRRFAAARG